MAKKDNEIRFDDDFFAEVKVNEQGETIVGRTYKGKGFKGIPLITFFSRAERIGDSIKYASATKGVAGRR